MNLINRIRKKSILVIGDIMLDTYFVGEVKRISPEAPVPVFRKTGERSVPGGAANVAVNAAAADQRVELMAVSGADAAGETLKTCLRELGVGTDMILPLQKRTTRKTRFIAENNQQVIRLDEEDTTQIDDAACARLLAVLEKQITRFSVVVLSDYNKGLLTVPFTQGVLRMARARGIRALVDVKGTNAGKYKGAYLVKPNLSELQMMTGIPVGTDEEVLAASRHLRELCGCEYVLTTRGGEGMLLVGGAEPVFVAADDHEVFDVTGAGDTALAYLAAALASGLPVAQATEIANHAAGIQVTKMGTSPVRLQEVSEAIPNGGLAARKLLDREAAARLRELVGDKRIVFTNGCFDILHVGHIRYLRQAAELGDVLVIGLNSDASVRRLKGEGRPVNPEADRAEILAALKFVDYIVAFEEDTPLELIRAIQPDVLVKGGDYTPEQVVGRDIVEERGGRLVLIDFVAGRSTTGIIQKIRKEDNDDGFDL